jgi:ParB-like chromosome segregation protein Spo0J
MSTKVSVDNDIPLAPRKRGRPPKAKKSVETTPSKWRDKYKVHPAADVFPMMSDEKLAKLGQDIKANGLRQPIVILHGMLVDGRNRLEAMERAGLPTGPDDVPI